MERWLAALYEGEGSDVRDRALAELDALSEPEGFAQALETRWTDERAVPAVAAIVKRWVRRQPGHQRKALHEVPTPMVLALRATLASRLLSLTRGDFYDQGAFLSVCPIFAARRDHAWAEARTRLEHMLKVSRDDRADAIAGVLELYFHPARPQ